MKRRWIMLLIAANLVVLVALAFVYPHLMISPGPLMAEHAALTTDCFACHAAGRGAAARKCATCHALPDIGLRTTKGVAIAKAGVKASFHQELVEQDCMACHSDHQQPKLTRRSTKSFSHALLRVAVRDNCASCHSAPANEIHREMKVGCSQCHTADHWKPAAFNHALLAPAVLAGCVACHKPPADGLHRQITGSCAQCHTPGRWKPASFEHSKLFALEGEHNTACVNCHANNDYTRYTCYGCHEHTPERIRAKHQEEGIRNFENCVQCHRNGGKEHGSEGGGRGRERD